MVRRNGDAWAAADYSALGGGLNGEFHPTNCVTLRTGYRADYRSFSDMSALSQFEQRGFASILANFETKTTLSAEVNVGAKLYDGQVLLDPIIVTTPGTTTDTVTGDTHGRGMGMRPAMRGTTAWILPQSQAQSGTAGLLSGLFRAAQSLSDRTGVHGQVAFRTTFGAVPPALVTTPAGFFDNGVYDDPFASNAVSGQSG